jgi:16S rRNA G527 N7-methylase RsmG
MIIQQCNGGEIVLTRNQIARINVFADLVKKWNGLGLIAKSTVNEIYRWHIFDGLSIFNLLYNLDCPVIDFGAGGGVVGIPLSITGIHNIVLVERCATKMTFLREIINYPIVMEDLQQAPKNSSFIVRGVSSIANVLNITRDFDTKRIVFFKSSNYQQELDEAKLCYSFHSVIYKRIYVDGMIVILSNIIKH